MNEAVKPAEADAVGDLVQLRKIGNSVGLILTKDILARFRLAEGDRFTVVQQPGGGVEEEGLTRWIRDNWPKDAPA